MKNAREECKRDNRRKVRVKIMWEKEWIIRRRCEGKRIIRDRLDNNNEREEL